MVIRRQKKIKIGWIIPTVGTFGAVREMVEVSNVLIEKGYQVYIYHPEGSACKWLKCLAECRKLGFLQHDHLDVLIGIVDWQPALYADLVQAKATVKAICLLGFDPSAEMAAALRGERVPSDEAQRIIIDAIHKKFLILADSSWQVEWVRKNVGYAAGPAFGGINLSMFHPPKQKISSEKIKIIYSGDPRERKGTDIVENAIEIIKSNFSDSDCPAFDHYWGRRFDQLKLVKFLQSGDIFLDAHRRAGWCNPVAEAIACGCVPVCTDIGASRDFALHEKTALRVPVNDAETMAAQTIRLIEDSALRTTLRENGLQHIKKFSYHQIVPVLEQALERRIHA